VTNGRHEVTLRLSPEHLGELRLTIVADRGQIAARFFAETAQARQAMSEGREQLRAALEQKGYTLHSLEIDTLSARDSEAIKPAPGQSQGAALDFSMNSGHLAGERRFGSPLSGEQDSTRSTVQSVRADRGSVPEAPDAGNHPPRRRADGRLDYQV
jgi:hypothetical protein